MKDFISEYLKDYLPNGIRFKKVEMPWSRMFEVLPILKIKKGVAHFLDE